MSLRNLGVGLTVRCLSASISLFILSISVMAQANGTRLLRTPTVSANQIAFAYAQNIWAVPRTGGTVRDSRVRSIMLLTR